MKTIVNNLAVEYRDEGEGPVLLMLHGWADNLYTWEGFTEQLQGFRIVRLDLPGFGGSERAVEAWDVKEYALFVRAFLQKMNIHMYILVGHSFGGRIAIKGVGSGILHPEKLILIASAGIAKTKTPRNKILRVIAKISKTITRIPPLSLWRHGIRKRLYARIGSDYFASGSMRDVFLKVIAEDLLADAEHIRVPTFLIWGRDDRSTPLSDGERIHDAIVRSELKIIDGGGHFVHHEKPEEIAQLIKNFI
jgi:pimeloyl-ACP methyl ester carboxylesterase